MNTHNTASSIECKSIHDLTSDEFSNTHFFGSRPVVLRDAMADWGALRKWGPEYFVKLYRGRQLDVGCNNRAVYGRLKEARGQNVARDSEKLECEEAMRRILSSESGRSYYLQQQSIPDLFPELMPDLQLPRWIPQEHLADVNLWFGGGGNVTPLHYDFSNNFLAQVTGVKHITLIAPEYFLRCYPAESANLFHLSLMDLENPDYDRFPNFKGVPVIQGTLRAGDLLYMPPFWWHFVTLDEPSISVNFWWRSHVSQCCCPAALKRLPGAFGRGALVAAIGQLDTSGFDSIHAIGKAFAARGVKAPAVLIVASGLEAEAVAHGRTLSSAENGGWRDRWSKIGGDAGWREESVSWPRALEIIESALARGDAGVTEEDMAGFIRGVAGFQWS